MTKRKTARGMVGKGMRRGSERTGVAAGRSQLKQSRCSRCGKTLLPSLLPRPGFRGYSDYITPEGPQIPNNFEMNKQENMTCPKSPEKSTNSRNRRHKQDVSVANTPCVSLSDHQCISEDQRNESNPAGSSRKKRNYVPQSAVALRCRVMPPPCIKNPYSKDTAVMDMDIFGDKRSKNSGHCSQLTLGHSTSRYRADFHEIEQIGCGNFSRVFKVVKRIDGACMQRQALMEVQALAALGPHENIVGYYSSWFENEQLYIQMELCDRCLCINRSLVPTVGEVLEALYQVTVAKALQFMHERGIAHLDVKPDNIYVKNGVYKLGDFGCATLIDRSLPIEEGDSRYMPQEIINDQYEYLDKVDVFSLGIATYELFSNLREGKIPLLPGISMQFQNLIKEQKASFFEAAGVDWPSEDEEVEMQGFERVFGTQIPLGWRIFL
ncbi:unnamed protein product [Spirodela intermedia]|uniref:Protein kinase domain-containing protein n=1 Tax=Spirodela intermedia TaxID=51605 RepID=A0A7I8JMR3_SPIIN|nr:unnamed protein product [Spirodela intermedia]CAA6671419.1 unnamed protein product [Spirodela intermedia]